MTMDNFELVKERLSISSVAQRYGATMKKKFANPSPCCQHNDCCAVDDVKRLFKCHSCPAQGSVIDLVMAVERCDKSEALRKCAEMAGIELKTSAQAAREEDKKPRESPQERMYRLAADYYEGQMKPGCAGWDYFVTKRGHKESTLKRLRAGFATGEILAYLQEHGFTISEIVKYGLATDTITTKGEDGKEIEKTVPPFDYYGKGMVVFPVMDHTGKVIAFTAKDPAKKKKATQLRGVGKKWFLNYPALMKNYSELFVVEGENDLASLIDAGYDNVIGTAGGPCQEQVVLLRNFCGGKTLYLWFDKDPDKDPRKNEGGPHHTRFIYQGLRGHNIDVRIISHPGAHKDPDDFLRAQTQTQEKGDCAA